MQRRSDTGIMCFWRGHHKHHSSQNRRHADSRDKRDTAYGNKSCQSIQCHSIISILQKDMCSDKKVRAHTAQKRNWTSSTSIRIITQAAYLMADALTPCSQDCKHETATRIRHFLLYKNTESLFIAVLYLMHAQPMCFFRRTHFDPQTQLGCHLCMPC
jgi:hypothetical protein